MSAAALVRALSARGRTVAVAESLTGGLLAAAFCGVPGASRCFLGGVTAYQEATKEHLLGVAPQTLARRGAVSAACAREMAVGARSRLGADYALATTGFAGPTGADVGLVYVALATENWVQAHRLRFSGSRQGIRLMTVQIALYLLQKEIEKNGQGKDHEKRH